MKMLFLLLCIMVLPFVYGGSKCPERASIYPCICIDRPIGKSKFDTTVICHRLDGGESLLAIEPSLTEMEINKFMLYDSYWPGNSRGLLTDSRIPINILSSFRIEEIEIVDTNLMSFACPENFNCRTNYLKRFTSSNSTMPEVTESAACNNNGITIKSWISCPAETEELIINNGTSAVISLKPEFFPEPLNKLKALHLTYFRILRVDKMTFSNTKFPVLQTLNLSHNSIRDANNMFLSTLKLKHLDLSHNQLRTLMNFQYLPHLQSLKLNDNRFIVLLETDWQIMPANLRFIDFTNNKIECNCGSKWINSTFPIHTVLLGSCGSPPEVENKKIRRASRLLIERCDEEGKIGSKKLRRH